MWWIIAVAMLATLWASLKVASDYDDKMGWD